MMLKNIYKKVRRRILFELRKQKSMTGASDYKGYKDFCKQAATDETVFKDFRDNPVYTAIITNQDFQKGKMIEDSLKKSFPDIYKNICNYSVIDAIGGGRKDKFECGNFSFTTLFYIYLYCQMKSFHLFDTPSPVICEIGVGYGGQCGVILTSEEVGEYNLVDLPETLDLSVKYLDKAIPKKKSLYKTVVMDDLPNNKIYDLAISNYSFCEFKRNIQEIYMKKVILKSKAGYMIYTSIGKEWWKNSYSVDELLKAIPNSFVVDLKPHISNSEKEYVIIWSNTQKTN